MNKLLEEIILSILVTIAGMAFIWSIFNLAHYIFCTPEVLISTEQDLIELETMGEIIEGF